MDSCDKYVLFVSIISIAGMFFAFWLGTRCERDEWVRKHATTWKDKTKLNEEGDEHESNHF